MKLIRAMTMLLVALSATCLAVAAQETNGQSARETLNNTTKNSSSLDAQRKRARRHKRAVRRTVIPPVTVLNNPEYISGEASISVAANSNPLIRIGIAQNGVTLIEFPSADRFFAVHGGNSDLVTVEKSPSLKRDHHLVLRAGSGFLVPTARAKASQAIMPATSIIAQMDSGMAITVMIYPVPLLKQQAHRLVIKYDRDEVITARRAAGLATNLVGTEAASQSSLAVAPTLQPAGYSAGAFEFADVTATTSSPEASGSDADQRKRRESEFKESVEAAVNEAVANPKWFKKWAQQRHGLRISTLPPRELNANARLVLFAVRNTASESLRLIAGYPDLYIETLNEKGKPVEVGAKVEKLSLASSGADNLLSRGETRYFALAYEAPILGAQQRLKIVVAHMNAADEPAMADLTALAR